MRERAIQALAAEGVPARVQAVEEHRRTADAIERRLDEVEQRIPWLDRVNFFSDTPDEELAHALRSQVVEARARLHAAQREADVAIDQALQGLPPLRIALLVERCVEKGRRSPELGIVTDEAAEAFATELLGLAEEVVRTWVGDPDSLATHADLLTDTDARRRAAAAANRASIAADDIYGFRRIAASDLIALAAAELERSGLGAARANLGAALASTAKPPADLVERQCETFDAAIERAFDVFPPMRIHAAAVTAAGVMDSGLILAEPAIERTTGRVGTIGVGGRILLVAALYELRAATDACFPGLTALLSGRGGERDRADLARAVARASGAAESPFRRPGQHVAAEPPPTSSEIDAWLAGELERAGTRTFVERALAHARRIGSLERLASARPEPSYFDRIVCWSGSTGANGPRVDEARFGWYREATMSWLQSALAAVDGVARASPLLRVRDAILAAHAELAKVATIAGTVDAGSECPVFAKETALAAVRALGAELGATLGLPTKEAELTPPAALYSALSDVHGAVQNVSAVLVENRHVDGHSDGDSHWHVERRCELRGLDYACGALLQWTRQASSLLGPFPSNAEVLAWYLERQHVVARAPDDRTAEG